MVEVNLLQISCLVLYAIAVVVSVFILLWALAKNVAHLFPYLTASGALFAITTGLAVYLKMMRIF